MNQHANRDDPTFSVVIAVRNGADTIERCISSVTDQGGVDAEIIVIDGASSDGTVSVLKSNSDKIAFWVSEPDRGICDA